MAYPVARGLAPALVAIGGWVFLGDRLLRVEIVAVGIIVLALVGLAWTPGSVAGLEWALLTGVMIALYTVVDAAAVRESGEALAYTVTLTAVSTGMLLPFALWKRGISGVAAAAKEKPLALGLASILNIGAYALVLVAATRAPVGLVAAVRESSVVIGAIAGIVLFSEPLRPPPHRRRRRGCRWASWCWEWSERPHIAYYVSRTRPVPNTKYATREGGSRPGTHS